MKDAIPRGRRACLLILLISAVLVSTGACAGRKADEEQPAGPLVEGRSGIFEIELPADTWVRSDIEESGSPPPDFYLTRMGDSAWIRAWSRNEQRLDAIVGDRRAALLSAGARNYRETRYFLGGSPRITASLARYIQGGQVILVLTAIRAPYAVELVAVTNRAEGHEAELLGILESVRFLSPGSES